MKGVDEVGLRRETIGDFEAARDRPALDAESRRFYQVAQNHVRQLICERVVIHAWG